MKMYTFSIHDADRDVPMFSCLAQSEKHAVMKCRAIGYKDFTLFETIDIDVDDVDRQIISSITTNPFVGADWLPFIDAASILIESRELDRREATWSFDFYRLTDEGMAERPFFVQGLVEMDGSMHLEMSGDINRDQRFTDDQIAQLEFMGWEKMDGLNIYSIEFEPGWLPRYIGERAVEALVAVHNVDVNHFFGFTVNKNLNDEIRTLTTLVDVTIRHESGYQDLFALPGSAAIVWAERARAEIASRESQETQQLPSTETGAKSGKPSSLAMQDGSANHGIISPEELAHSPAVADWYDDDEWTEFDINALAFRSNEGEILLEVLPKIFLSFNPDKAPEIEDFFYQPRPWLQINAEQFRKSKLRKRFHPGLELREFMHFFARSAYESDGAPIPSPLDLDEVGQHSQIVARGIYGASFHENGEYLINRASALRWLVDDLEHDFGKRDSDDESETLAPQAFLSLVPEWGSRCFYRPISAEDLDGWGIPEFVVQSLETMWTNRASARVASIQATAVTTHRLNSGYRAIRLAELLHRWTDFGYADENGFSTSLSEGKPEENFWLSVRDYSDSDNSDLSRLRAIVRETSRVLAVSESGAVSWLKERAPNPKERSEISTFRRRRILERPTEKFTQDVSNSLRFAMSDENPDSYSLARVPHSHRIAIDVMSRVMDMTGGPKIHDIWSLQKSPYLSISDLDFDDDGFLDISELPENYAGWMADRVVATLHLLSRGLSAREISAEWNDQHFQSPARQGRIDELCFAMLFLDRVYIKSAQELDPLFREQYVDRTGGKFKDLISYVMYPPGWDMKNVHSPVSYRLDVGEEPLTERTFEAILDTTLLYLSEVTLRFGKTWLIQFSGDFDCVDITIRAEAIGAEMADDSARQLQLGGFGVVRTRGLSSLNGQIDPTFELTCSFSIAKKELANSSRATIQARRLESWVDAVSPGDEVWGVLDTPSPETRARIVGWSDEY